MFLLTYALPIAAALLLIAFFSGLPLLSRCALPEARSRRFDRRDGLFLAFVTLVYAAVAFWNLGDTRAPESFVPMEGRSVVLTLPEGAEAETLWLYPGVGIGSYAIETSSDGQQYTELQSFEQNHVAVLKWDSLPLADAPRPIRYLQIRCTGGTPWLGELAVRDAAERLLPLQSEEPALIDEGDTVPERSSFMNSSYFDEIYHARTAWEHLNGIWPYEISHPPLGKEILSLGILLFGMTPFGWRFSGTFFGVLMLPVMYLLLKRLFGGRTVPALGTVVFATDFMHFVQTRIATIDTYSVFFILLMYLFMLIWLEEDSPLALALCGLSFGLGAASKWTSLYAGAGLAVLWAAHWVVKARAAHGDKNPILSLRTSDRRHWCGNPSLFPAFVKNALLCLLVFVALPCAIYYLSYLPYGRALGHPLFSGDYLRMVLDNQRFMFNYHAGIVAEHPYSSRWYQWLLNIRPILYYLEYFSDGRRISICALLNPALCWGGFLSLFVLLYTAVFRRDRRAAFILVGYLAQLLPWVFISRLTFAYHYFPSSVFLVLALGYVFALYRENKPAWTRWAIPFAVVSLLLFVMFYPVLAGAPVDNVAASRLLAWFPTWPV